jgi:hypothetical protein
MIAETEDLLDSLKAHKPDILAALAHPDGIALWWRVAILVEPSGRTVEVDTPSGYTLAVASLRRALSRPWVHRDADRRTSQARAPIKLDEALRAACEGVGGITPAQFR